MSELLPCPFCGSIRAELGTSQDAGVTKWSVICANCGSSCSLYCDSEHDAVELWNMRTPAQRAPTRRVPKVRTSHHRNKEEAARLQALVDKRCARGGDDAPALTSTPGQAIEKTDGGAS